MRELLISVILGVALLRGSSAQWFDPHCDGKQVIVHLFEWKWNDIAAECERFLGPMGFCGVQVRSSELKKKRDELKIEKKIKKRE
jgi:alpha-amylase